MGLTAKAWGRAPSEYFPELGTFEAFCLDETIAYVLSVREQEIIDQYNQQKGATDVNAGQKQGKKPQRDIWDILTDSRFEQE